MGLRITYGLRAKEVWRVAGIHQATSAGDGGSSLIAGRALKLGRTREALQYRPQEDRWLSPMIPGIVLNFRHGASAPEGAGRDLFRTVAFRPPCTALLQPSDSHAGQLNL